ncbi:MAG: hypothetical protein RMJ43_13345, partial [Chloroherpetonaceae bacterium]|nr:hypothetical protein [Chloroherpetonaceae bacterium]
MLDPLSKYIGIFNNLQCHRNPNSGLAPHTPILLLAVLDEIKQGNIRDNFIAITPGLIASFRSYWRMLVPPNTWHGKIAYPFRFLVQDGFWELVKDGVPISAHSLGYNPTIRQLTTQVDGARLASDLWKLLQDHSALSTLQSFLLKRYFNISIADTDTLIQHRSTDYEYEKLKGPKQNKFREVEIKEAPSSYESPVEALRKVCPAWTEEQADWVWQEIRAGWSDAKLPEDAMTILKHLYPEGPWNIPAGRTHAAYWLLWLSERALPVHHLPLIKTQAQQWEALVNNTERSLYQAHTPDAATTLLEQW